MTTAATGEATSEVAFEARADATYYIAVAGHDGASGDILLHLKAKAKSGRDDAPVAPGAITVRSKKLGKKIRLRLEFSDRSTDEEYFVVQASRQRPGRGWMPWQRKARHAAGHGGSLDLTISLSAGDRYRVRVGAVNSRGASYSPVKRVSTSLREP